MELNRNGTGTFTDALGHRYVGSWVNGQREGKGTYSFAGQKKDETIVGNSLFYKGNRYVGQWRENKFNGNGSFKYLNGDTYDGSWILDKRDGQGIFTSANGEHYDGQWRNVPGAK